MGEVDEAAVVIPVMTHPISIVGILNVTPDSYYDGGKYDNVESALIQAKKLIDDGADILEVGGESTGPGSIDVSEVEELRRIIPVITEIHRALPEAKISVDTYKSAIARAACEAGAVMVNDVTAGRGDSRMFDVLAKTDARLVLMYAKDSTPRTTVEPKQYDDVLKTVKEFLVARLKIAEGKGIAKNRIILDPGLGQFISSDPQYSWEILERLQELQDLGCPILVSPSRKSFLAGPEKLPVAQRLPATLQATELALRNGATFIRTHDVRETHVLIDQYRKTIT